MFPYYDQPTRRVRGIQGFVHRIVPIPLHLFVPLWEEIRFMKVRLRSLGARRRYRNEAELLINLGAGKYGKPGWVNVDWVRHSGINCIYDCRRGLPFGDESARAIFCEHFLEHLDYTEHVPRFLSECRRVLRPGGVLRVIVPDAERYLRAYCDAGWESLAQLRPLDADRSDRYFHCRYRTKIELINQVFRQGHAHKYAYDYETLEFLLRRYGFSQVQRCEFGQSQLSEFAIDQPRRASESLYVEAVKG
jgi:predicted SAM-dependent methyltransferase